MVIKEVLHLRLDKETKRLRAIERERQASQAHIYASLILETCRPASRLWDTPTTTRARAPALLLAKN